MVSSVKLEKYNASIDSFHNKYFSPVDITNQLALPINNNSRCDDVLDTTNIVLYNAEQDAIKPFTRIKLTITDEIEGVQEDNFIYRYVENDTVTNICLGNEPIYKHTLSLIEITKITERVAVDNLTFTNYLDENYGFDQEAKYTKSVSGGGIFGWFWVENIDHQQNNNTRLRGPYQYVGTSINTGFRMNVICGTRAQYGGLVFAKSSYTVPMTQFYVIDPDGIVTHLSNLSTFTYTKVGKYRFFQRYYINENPMYIVYYIVRDADIRISWEVNVIEQGTQVPQRYNIAEVVDRLLKVCELRRRGIDSQRFVLDETVRPRLQNILSPEFSFTQGTLFEALSLIGSYIHAIPRLIPEVVEKQTTDVNGSVIATELDDYNNWNTITFDFLGDATEEFTENNYSLYDAVHSADDFARNFVANIENGTQSNYSSNVAITEPFLGGFISPRTEEANFEISNDNAVIKLTKDIGLIIEVIVVNNGVERNITNRVLESAKYNLLDNYSTDAGTNNKAYYLEYTRGSNIIKGLTYRINKEIFLDAWTDQIAIKNILSLNDTPEANIKNLAFRIKYIPFLNFKVKQFKQVIDNSVEKNELYYNQQSNAVDIESFGEQVKGTLLRTGNHAVAETQYFSDYADTPRAGQISMDNYYAFAVNKEIYVGTPVKTTTEWSKDYNKLNEFIGLKKSIRQYEISESESVKRNPDYQEFCIVSNNLDVSQLYNSDNISDRVSVINELNGVAFGVERTLNQIKSKLNNENITYKALSYAIIKTTSVNDDGSSTENKFLLPVSCSPFGNSVVINFKATDNYSAGTYSEDKTDEYNIEKYVRYSNDKGRFEDMEVCIGSDNAIPNGFSSASDIKANAKMLYKFDVQVNEDDIFVDYRNFPFIVDKDSREEISFTGQLNFVSDSPSIIIGKGLAHTMPLVGDISTDYKFVAFTVKPNKFALTIDTETFVEQTMPSITVNNETKSIMYASTTALTNCVGYGILDGEGRLCIYVNDAISAGESTKPIYLLFRGKV